jgi:hypothetical protein
MRLLITQVLRQREALLAPGDPAVVFFPRAGRRWQGRGPVARVLPETIAVTLGETLAEPGGPATYPTGTLVAVPRARGTGWSLAECVIPAHLWPTQAAR